MTRGHIKADTSQEFSEHFFLGHALCEKINKFENVIVATPPPPPPPRPLERHNEVLKHKFDLCCPLVIYILLLQKGTNYLFFLIIEYK